MAIPDPHAIPETEAACVEYLHEADAAWDAEDNDLAYELYDAARNSAFCPADRTDHVNLRLGLIAQTRGDVDDAVVFFHASHDPGARDALHALTNATTHDRSPSPDDVPATAEEAFAWIDAALAAERNSDYQRAHDLFQAVVQCTVLTPGQLGAAHMHIGISLEHLGQPDDARSSYAESVSLLSDAGQLEYVRGRIKALGGGAAEADDDSGAAAQVAAGLAAYENADAAGARAAFEAALHLDGTVEEKGRAHYYLGSMDYQAGRYADARNHVEAAVAGAPEPERSWAESMLQWRWDQNPAPAAPGAGGQIDI